MCTGIALSLSDLPVAAAADPRLSGRVYEREGRRELQFHWWQSPALLPVLWEGQFHVLPWGGKSRNGVLPYGGWLLRAKAESGWFAGVGAEPAIVPANLGHHKGTWFLISEGIRCLVLKDSGNRPVAYLLTEPSSNYYKNMTEQEPFMPVLVGQVI